MLNPSAVGCNIRTIRKLHGESQKELANIVGCSESNIRAYEKGVNCSEDIISRIAEHYNISYRLITTIDFVECGISIASELNIDIFDKYDKVIDALTYRDFPKDSLNDANINIAQHLLDSLRVEKNNEEFASKALQFIDLTYEIMFEENDSLSPIVAINIINLIISAEAKQKNFKLEDLMDDEENIDLREVLKKSTRNINKYNGDEEERQNNVLFIMLCIYHLRKNMECRELADFYNVYRYFLGYGSGNRSKGDQIDIGTELMMDLAEYGNEYAKEYMDFIMDIFTESDE